MPARNTEHDIVLFNAGATPNTRKLKLLSVLDPDTNRGRKLWRVFERQPASIEADFKQKDWTWGPGLNTIDFGSGSAGSVLRYSDGYGIDTTEGIIKQGPGATSVGAVTGTVKKILLGPDDRVWIVTSSHLYGWNGTVLENFWGDGGSTHGAGVATLEDAVVHGSDLIVAAGTNGYYHTDGTAAPTNVTSISAVTLDTSIMEELNGTLYIQNTESGADVIRGILDPAGTASIGTPITIGDSKNINRIFPISGILMIGTETSIFTIASDDTVTELSKKLRDRAGPDAFSVIATDGEQAWLGDVTPEVLRLQAVGFDEFDVTFPGPFARTQEELPFTETSTAGNVTGAALDIDFVYLAVDRGGDLYVYKGAEVLRGRFVWSPLIRRTSATNNVIGVAKMTADTAPILYLDDGGTIYEYDTRDWTKYNTDAQVITSYFPHEDEAKVKQWNLLRTLYEGDSTGGNITVQAAQRSGTLPSYTNVGTAQGTGAHELNSLISNPRVQLRFTWSSTDDTKHIDIKSFTLEGLVRPALKKVYDFTVRVPNATVAAWLYSLRTIGTSFTQITDPIGNQTFVYVLPGTPEESIIEDTILQREVLGYRIVAEEE